MFAKQKMKMLGGVGAFRHRLFGLPLKVVDFITPGIKLGLKGLALVLALAGAASLMWPTLAQ